MKYQVLKNIKLQTSKGTIELTPGEVVKLPQDIALQLLNDHKTEPVEPAMYRIYSEILNDCLWIVEAEQDRWKLASDGVIDPIYAHAEIREMKSKGMTGNQLQNIHRFKKVFPGSTVDSVKERES